MGGDAALSAHSSLTLTGGDPTRRGFAGLAGSPWGWIFPVLLFCFFKCFNPPMLDRHMAEHYGEPYAARTASIIPFLE